MYDVRGIQDYIFRTSKMKDAIGASSIVEGLFDDALKQSSSKLGLKFDGKWCDDNKRPLHYEDETDADAVVLYIGGGNACVVYRDKETAVSMNREMARYTLDRTYSLQLAVAMVEKTGNYSSDYAKLMDEMVRVKDRMMVNKPLDALPVMKVEIKTGLPVSAGSSSTESAIKTKAGDKARDHVRFDQKLFDNYVEGKGESSMLAVVHIDGNNMGQRIRDLISGIDDYTEAVNEMRRISCSINSSYKEVFRSMEERFNEIKDTLHGSDAKDASKWWIMKIIDAGDDITYVCNAGIAFATAEYFCRNISEHSMNPASDDIRYRFSACAGISYFNSHFPFNIAYNVAEECCESAKSRAKKDEYKDGELVANWVDFQFCRSVHAQNLEKIRKDEYVTAAGEDLLRRPYYIYTEALGDPDGQGKGSRRFEEMREEFISYDCFVKDLKQYVLDDSNVPRSFVKEMRNTYPLGSDQMDILKAFLKSRENVESTASKKVKYPDEFYKDFNGKKTARYYDALEVADYFRLLDDLMSAAGKEARK